MQHRSIRLAAAAFALALVLAACGGDDEIGSGLKADGSQGGDGAIRDATTTTAVKVSTTVPSATTVKPTATTAAVPNAIFKIQDDNKGQYIEPLHHAVRSGALVRFVNEDDSAHTINLKIGSTSVHKSPVIPPGGLWDVRPTTKGTYDVVDEDRTYAAGVTLTVG
jgi:plastocyanin